MNTSIYAYRMESESARALADNLGCKLIRHVNSKYKPGHNKRIINWGANDMPQHLYPYVIINRPGFVRVAANKLEAFRSLLGDGVSIPDYTTDKVKANTWLAEGITVIARTILNGHAGAGIVVVMPGEDLPMAPLYTKYIPKKYEWRVHIFNGEMIDVQQKVRKAGEGDGKFHIRNHDNGFVFARQVNGFPVLDTVKLEAVTEAGKAVKALGLTFGGVDVIWNEKQKKAYVLEVNTAPGIEGQTVISYGDAIRKL